MSENRPVTLDFIAAQLQRVVSEIRILRDDVDVVAATTRRIDSSYDRLDIGLRSEMREIRDEMREIRAELRAMHAQHQRMAARVRALEDGAG
jgi:prefoldin subunit 5